MNGHAHLERLAYGERRVADGVQANIGSKRMAIFEHRPLGAAEVSNERQAVCASGKHVERGPANLSEGGALACRCVGDQLDVCVGVVDADLKAYGIVGGDTCDDLLLVFGIERHERVGFVGQPGVGC